MVVRASSAVPVNASAASDHLRLGQAVHDPDPLGDPAALGGDVLPQRGGADPLGGHHGEGVAGQQRFDRRGQHRGLRSRADQQGGLRVVDPGKLGDEGTGGALAEADRTGTVGRTHGGGLGHLERAPDG